jgi:nucleobase:cation symporter-1, NCS1 family
LQGGYLALGWFIMPSIFKYFKPSYWALEPDKTVYGPSNGWSNKDMDPVPLDRRTWTTWNYVAYWISDATNAGAWAFASSMLVLGLSW